MKIKIKRFDKSIPLPEYKTAGAAAFDLAAREETIIEPGETGKIPLNVAVEFPHEYVGILAVRSSTYKMGLSPANGIGIMDSDYCGDADEYHLVVWNRTEQSVKIEKGQRIAQLMVIKKEKFEIEEVEKMEGNNRGGFGTTGKI